ncbi:MAG: DAK2 domain-containing protein [Stappiaceae bacterium]
MNDEFLNALVKRFEGLERELNLLDAATGDGDHGTTILKGLRAAADAPDAPAKAFRKAAGGASGSLFSTLIGALNEVLQGEAELSAALSKSSDRISQLGQAKPGEKTMLDALVPASAHQNAQQAANAARAGCKETRAMAARRGRARYVEGAGVGHVDAGATSVAEILDEFAKVTSEDV